MTYKSQKMTGLVNEWHANAKIHLAMLAALYTLYKIFRKASLSNQNMFFK